MSDDNKPIRATVVSWPATFGHDEPIVGGPVPVAPPAAEPQTGGNAGVTQDDNIAVDKLIDEYPDVEALPGPVLDGITQALANSRAAGRARGIEEERKRCERIVRESACKKTECQHESCRVSRAILAIIDGTAL